MDILNDLLSSHSKNDEFASEVEVRFKYEEEEVLVLVGLNTEGTGVGANETVGTAAGLSGVAAAVYRVVPLPPINECSLALARVGLPFETDAVLTRAEACFLNFDSKARGLRPLEGLLEPISRVLMR